MSRKDDRKKEIAALRDEGYAAFEAGKSPAACPRAYRHTMNILHWMRGYDEARADSAIVTEEGVP